MMNYQNASLLESHPSSLRARALENVFFGDQVLGKGRTEGVIFPVGFFPIGTVQKLEDGLNNIIRYPKL